MDRAEAGGLGIAIAGHGALLAALSLGFASAVSPPAMNSPIEVSFVDEIGLQSAVTEISTEPPAQSVAPDMGPPEEAAPAEREALPEPAPTPKQAVEPAPQKPAPKSAPPKAEPKKQAPPKSTTKSNQSGKGEKTTGSRLGDDFLKGIGNDPSPSRSQKPTGSVMSTQAAASIGAAIKRQVQPCADRQVNPGPGANQITTAINLRLNRDGSLARRPTVVRQTGITDSNKRYAERVADLAIAAFVGCSPLRGLPEDLYDVPNGWSNFTLNYSLPG